MAQIMRPISNISDDGHSSGTPSGYGMVDGVAPDTGDWWYGTNQYTDSFQVLMTDLSATPPANGYCYITIYQSQADSDAATTAPTTGGSNATFDLEVYQGTTPKALAYGIPCSADGSFAIYNGLTFFASTITDWSDIRVRFVSHGTNSGPSADWRSAAVSYIEISTPDSLVSTTDVDLAGSSYAVMGNDLSVPMARSVDLAGGSYALTGYSAQTALTRSLALDLGYYSASGGDLDILLGTTVPLDAGNYAVTGSSLTVSQSATVDLAGGNYSITRNDLSLSVDLALDLAAGSYVATGNDLNASFGVHVDLAGGSYVIVGNDFDLSVYRLTKAVLAAGSYVLTGYDHSTSFGRSVDLVAGSYVITGNSLSLESDLQSLWKRNPSENGSNSVILVEENNVTLDGANSISANRSNYLG